MNMVRAAYAAKKLLDFKIVLPSHYRTFDLLAQTADVLRDGLPGVKVMELEVMVGVEV